MKTLLITFSLTLICLSSHSQVLVDQTVLLEEIPNMFLGDDYDISNITYSGNPEQIGIFFGNESNLDMELGMIMGTGNVNLASSATSDAPNEPGPGGNSGGGSTLGGGNFGSGDSDIAMITGLDTHDAVTLEFDFVAIEGMMSFEYIFASEEYPEYTCSSFNDAFGFFLSGPGISGEFSNSSANIATIPDSDPPIFVSIDNINDNVCGEENIMYYVDNSETTTDPEAIEYDGFTVTMPAEVQLIVGETYHLKLAIADTGDTVFDSAVFIKSSTSAFVWTESEGYIGDGSGITTLGDDQIMEGCFNGEFDLYLSYAASMTIQDLSLSGSAEMGLDFEDVTDYLTLPENFVGIHTIPINVISDSENEGEENVILTLTFMNEFGELQTVSNELIILDKAELETSLEPEYSLCTPDDILEIDATITSGVEPISYAWSNSSESAIQTFDVQSLGDYSIEIIDHCGNSVYHELSIAEAEDLVLSTDQTICTNTYSESIIETGAAPFTFSFDLDNLTIEETMFGSSEPGTYSIEVTDYCGDADQFELIVEICDNISELFGAQFKVTVVGSNLNITSNGTSNNVLARIFDSKGSEVSPSQLLNPALTSIDVSYLSAGNYILELSDGNGKRFAKKFNRL